MPHAPTSDDVEQLRHVAADADGAPLADADLAFLASDQQALRIDDDGGLFVVGIAQIRYYAPTAVRAAIADARAVWAVIQHSRQPDPEPAPADDPLALELGLEASEE